MPKMMKNVQQINTILPIGRSDDSSVCTTNFNPGARLITLSGLKDLNSLNTCCMKELLNVELLNIATEKYS